MKAKDNTHNDLGVHKKNQTEHTKCDFCTIYSPKYLKALLQPQEQDKLKFMVRIFLKSNSLVIAECRKFMPHNV
jgi:hypothetical protein